MKSIAFAAVSIVSTAPEEFNSQCRRMRKAMRLQLAVIISVVIIGFLLATATSAKGQDFKERTWSDSTGQFSVDATLIDVDDTSVKLLREDGEEISVPISRLSSRDRVFLKRATSTRTKKSSTDAIRKVIADALAGPALPPAETKLADLHELLPFPVFIDVRGIERVGFDVTTPVKLIAGHSSLQEQLDETLNTIELSWCTTQTVLVVSSLEALEDRFAQTKLYRIATPGRDFSSVMQRLQQVSEGSWEVFGGYGSIVPLVGLGPVYVIRQSPKVHRELIKAFHFQPAPHKYRHPFDLRSITISMKATSIKDILASIGSQIDVSVEESTGLLEAGLDLSNDRMNVELEDVSAKDALDLVLSQVECTWVEDEQKLTIMTMKDGEKALSTQRLSINLGAMNASQVINAFQISIAPDNWEVLGGEGMMRVSRPGLYVIRQGQPAMREFEQFVRELLAFR